MSDSGRQMGDCKHLADPAWCVYCLREQVMVLEDKVVLANNRADYIAAEYDNLEKGFHPSIAIAEIERNRLRELVVRLLDEVKLHNQEYRHVTPKDVIEEVESVLERGV